MRWKPRVRRVFWATMALCAVLLFYFRTWIHAPVMFLYTRPAVIQAVVVWALLHVYVLRRWKMEKTYTYKDQQGKQHRSTFRFRWLSYMLLPLLITAASVAAPILTQVHLVRDTQYHVRDALPEAAQEIRLLPYEVAQRYARDSLQLSQYKLGTENIAIVDDQLSWVFPLVPDGLIIKFTLQNKGMSYVNAAIQERNSQMVWKDMAIGEGMQVTDNLWWNLYRSRYFVTTEDPYYIPREDDIYTVVPAIEYSHHFNWGVWYTVPRFAGSFIVNTDGEIELVSTREALDHPVLEGNIIFPERLTRLQVSAYQYHLGVGNRFFLHDDQVQIQDISRVNRQPFLMATAEGLKWFVSTEPYGASHGIFKIFLADARTGKMEIYELPEDEVLTGPVRASDYVRQSNPLVDWDRFIMAEPLPFVRNGVLYWKVAVIPEDAAGIAYQAFVDSRTNQVVELRNTEDIRLFARGGIQTLPQEDAIEDIIEAIFQKIEELENLVEELERLR